MNVVHADFELSPQGPGQWTRRKLWIVYSELAMGIGDEDERKMDDDGGGRKVTADSGPSATF